MKMIKKIVTMAAAVMLLAGCYGFNSHAADGTLMFSDPETKTGEKVGVDLVVEGPEAIGDVEVVVQYDSSMLEFAEGENVEGGDGQVTFRASGDGSTTSVRTTMYFNALKEGETNLSVTSSTAYLYSDETLYLSEGGSVVKIGVGDGTVQNTSTSNNEDIAVMVGETEYRLSDNFTSAMIPEGYTETTLQYSGAERKFITNEANTIYLGYLLDSTDTGSFFLYEQETASFAPYVEFRLSNTTSIVLLDDISGITLPERYQEATLTINQIEFPVWQDMEQEGYYVVYALNSAGAKNLYQFDLQEETYQRIQINEEKKGEETAQAAAGIIGKIQKIVDRFFTFFFIAGVAIVLLLIILLIVLSVKLRFRNQELDDLYEEYGIDEKYEAKPQGGKGTPKKQSAAYEEDEYEDEYDDYSDEDDEYDEYEDEYEDDEYDDEYEDEYDEEEDDEEDEKGFGIDFIDL